MLTEQELLSFKPELKEYWLPKRIPPTGYWSGYFDAPFLNKLVEQADLKRDSTTLVMESGSVLSGAVAASVARESPEGHVIGIDHNPRHQELAKKYAAKLGQTGIEFKDWNEEDIPLPDESVDAITVKISFHHLMKPSKALAEMSRVLKHGGKIAFSDFVSREDDESFHALNEFAVRQHNGAMTSWMKPSALKSSPEECRIHSGPTFSYDWLFTLDTLSAGDTEFRKWALDFWMSLSPSVKRTLEVKPLKDDVEFLSPGMIVQLTKE